MRVEFTVYGVPQTAGSKRAFPFHKPGGKLGVAVTDNNPKGKPWMAAVAAACREAYDGPLLDGALGFHMLFFLPRPKSHFGTGRNAGVLKPSSPLRPAVTPDLTKLVRCTEDALQNVLWTNDSRIVEQGNSKLYATCGRPAKATITVWVLDFQTLADRLAYINSTNRGHDA